MHQDSPDSRGIDCALLFSNKFKLLKYDFISIKILMKKDRPRYCICKAAFKDEAINVFVNHWPSRWGGQAETNLKRLFAAKGLKDYLQSNISNAEYTLIMGDFNDYPFNESIAKFLSQVFY